jgi:hypothetical protein
VVTPTLGVSFTDAVVLVAFDVLDVLAGRVELGPVGGATDVVGLLESDDGPDDGPDDEIAGAPLVRESAVGPARCGSAPQATTTINARSNSATRAARGKVTGPPSDHESRSGRAGRLDFVGSERGEASRGLGDRRGSPVSTSGPSPRLAFFTPCSQH